MKSQWELFPAWRGCARLLRGTVAAACLLIVVPSSRGQIHWRSAEAGPLAVMSPAEVAQTLAELVQPAQKRHVVVQFSSSVDPDARETLRASGVELLAYLGDHAFFAGVSGAQLDVASLSQVQSLQSAQTVLRGFKLHPLLAAGNVPEYAAGTRPAEDGSGRQVAVVAAYVLFHGDVPRNEAADLARQHGADIRTELQTVNALVVEMPRDQVGALADRDQVQWIEPALPPLTTNNDSNRAATGANVAQSIPYGLDGSGVVVLVYDGGFALASHMDFGGRLTVRDSSGLSDHATHVSATVGGSGALSGGHFRGMAPGVTIESYGFQYDGTGIFLYTNPGDIESDYGQAINSFGAVISNNSIGTNTATNGFPCEITGDYGVTSSVIDGIVRGSLGERIRVVWANGNERQTSRCGSTYATTAPPACAKNHITVGALNSNNNSVTSFTSWGPADDGRIKPDVSAPGCQSNDDFGVTSADASGGYVTFCGTSMASPTTAGSAALLLQDFRDQFPALPDFLPSTLKALVAHNAMDIQNAGPDYQTGYGLIQVDDTVDFLRSGRFIEDQVDNGQTYMTTVVVPPGAPELKVTLAWDDFPGTPNVIPSLINDLDLRVFDPSSTQHFPWTLNPGNPSAPAVQSQADHLNNIEQVLVASPAAGTWTIEVFGNDVPEGPQLFSLVGDGAQIPALSIKLLDDIPQLVGPGVPVVLDLEITARGQSYVPDSATLHYRFNAAAFQTAPLSPQGGDSFQAVLPGADCNDVPEFYFSAQASTTGVKTLPADAPASVFGFGVGTVNLIFADDLETDAGWTVGAPGDDATTGVWTRVDPVGTAAQPEDDHTDAPGTICFVTGQGIPGGGLGDNDVDGGRTTLTTPVIDVNGVADAMVSYYRWYSNDTGAAPNSDLFEVEVSDDDGASWVDVETVGPGGVGANRGWFYHEFRVSDFVTPTSQVRVRFIASDEGSGSLVEAAVDDLRAFTFSCTDVGPGIPGDFDGDGDVDLDDFGTFAACFNGANNPPAPGCPPGVDADLDGDGDVDLDDFSSFSANYTGSL